MARAATQNAISMGGHTRLAVKRLWISDTRHYLACIFSVGWDLSIRNESHLRMTSSSLAPVHAGDELRRISRSRVFFGHQSVGAEILRGLADLAEDEGIRLNLAETRALETGSGPCLAHARIGRNGDPAAKFDDFAAVLDGGLAADLDLAMMKLCYVDVTRDTDATDLARQHDAIFDGLAARHPGLRLLAVTVPLTTGLFGLRGRIANLLGRSDPAAPDNRARARYNDHLRARYADCGLLFDLAAVEAASAADGPDAGGIPSLSPSLTRDGGHLNRRGRKLAAIALAGTLGRLL